MVIEGTEKDIRTYYINLTRLNLEKTKHGINSSLRHTCTHKDADAYFNFKLYRDQARK